VSFPLQTEGLCRILQSEFKALPGPANIDMLVAAMGCLIGCLALVTPRIALALVFIFSNYLGRAYDTVLWPVLGFFFMPLTTLAYAWAVNTNGTVTGVYLAAVVVAVLLDLGLIGGSGASARRRYD
jgi:hypothetical protein